MLKNGDFDEDRTKLLLVGERDDIAEGLNLIDSHLGKKITGRLRRRYPGLAADDLADVWQETLTSVFQKVSKGEFDLDGALVPWLCTIARRRAADLFRKNAKYTVLVTTDDEVLNAVGEALVGCETGAQWRLLEAQERKEVLDLIFAEIQRLPRKQRIIFQVFCDGYPETQESAVLRRNVSTVTGEEETLASVKRALQEGRRKLRDYMARLENQRVKP